MKLHNFKYENDKWVGIDSAIGLDSENTLVLAFCAPLYREKTEVFKELKSHFPQSQIVGCSTSGEIHQNQVEDLSISLVALKFETGNIKVAKKIFKAAAESEKFGEELATHLDAPDLKSVLVLSDGLKVNGSSLSRGFNKVLHENVVVAGGLAGDGNHFNDTFVLHNDEIISGGIVAVGMYGENLAVCSTSRGGWDIFGSERVITKSQGNVLFEIDGRPALDLYKEYLGDKAKDLPSSGLLFPLQIRSNKGDENSLVRTVLAVDETENTVTFAGDVPQGYLAQFMRANFERVIEAAAEAAEKSIEIAEYDTESDSKNFVLAVSCVGRRLVLGERTEEELEAIESSFKNTPCIAGFYSYGEIGAQIHGNSCDLHNQTMTLLVISEEKLQSKKLSA